MQNRIIRGSNCRDLQQALITTPWGPGACPGAGGLVRESRRIARGDHHWKITRTADLQLGGLFPRIPNVWVVVSRSYAL